MTHARFQMFNIAGAVLWVVSLVTAGYLFGNIPIIQQHLTEIVLIGISAAMIPLAIGGLVKFARRMLGK